MYVYILWVPAVPCSAVAKPHLMRAVSRYTVVTAARSGKQGELERANGLEVTPMCDSLAQVPPRFPYPPAVTTFRFVLCALSP